MSTTRTKTIARSSLALGMLALFGALGCGSAPAVDPCGGCAAGEQCTTVLVTITGDRCYPFASCQREGHTCVDPRKVNMLTAEDLTE